MQMNRAIELIKFDYGLWKSITFIMQCNYANAPKIPAERLLLHLLLLCLFLSSTENF